MSNRSATASDLLACFISPNEEDRNLEAANVVDGLFAIARGLEAVAQSIQNFATERRKEQA